MLEQVGGIYYKLAKLLVFDNGEIRCLRDFELPDESANDGVIAEELTQWAIRNHQIRHDELIAVVE